MNTTAVKTARQIIKGLSSNQRALITLKANGIVIKTTARHGSFLTEISGNTYQVRNEIKAMGGQWLDGWKTWVVVPGKFDAGKLASAL
jgi:hypothetical protein